MKAADNPLLGQQAPKPEGIPIADDVKYEVQEILAVRRNRSKLQY